MNFHSHEQSTTIRGLLCVLMIILLCQHVLCCSPVQDAYSEVASLFAEFFRDLDIVPSDIIAGLVLLRQRQRSKRSAILDQVSLSIKNIYINVCIFVLAQAMCCNKNMFLFCFHLLRPTMTFQPSYLECLSLVILDTWTLRTR